MFSLRTLLIAIAVAALGIAAIVNRTPLWASAFVTLTIALILAATVLAILRPTHRAFWAPTAIVGIAYTLTVYCDPLRDLHYQLLSTQITINGWEWLHRAHRQKAGIDDASAEVMSRGADDPFGPPFPPVHMTGRAVFARVTEWHRTVDEETGHLRAYYWSAQSLWTLVLAFGSGLVSWHFLRPRSRETSNPVPTPQSPSSPA
jgi:hypothetical protein